MSVCVWMYVCVCVCVWMYVYVYVCAYVLYLYRIDNVNLFILFIKNTNYISEIATRKRHIPFK